MPVDNKHPEYVEHKGEWALMRDTLRGPVRITERGQDYLPMPSGFTTQSDQGVQMYGAYQARARFPDIVAPTTRGMTGLIHRKEAQVQLPPAMEPLIERCTSDGLTLEAFHMLITQELIRVGRFGVLAEAAPEGSDVPFLAGYKTESIINWDKEGKFFVLDESQLVRNGFAWENKKQFRMLELKDGAYQQTLYSSENEDSGEIINPTKRGNGSLEAIPFVVASPNELSTAVGEIPLIGVARAAIAIYQLDADYRLQLYMSGQETFVVVGAESVPPIVGASVKLSLPLQGSASYVGPSGKGIEAHVVAINNAKSDAVAAGAQLFDDKQSGQESGEALRLRYGAQTATLQTIAQQSAACLERSLRNIAIFMNLNPELVVVKPNLRFVQAVMTPADGEALMRMWMGAAISKLTLHENLVRGEIASEERTFEEEEALIEDDELDRAAKADEQMERERAAQTPDEDEDEDEPPPSNAGGGEE